MQIKSTYINLPVKDPERSRNFWSKLGFTFNEQFSDEKAICLILKEGSIYCMLLQQDFFSTFTDRQIADTKSTQVLVALEVESRERVDAVVKTAMENGGSRYRSSEDHGWMYYDSFCDPDGHQWEVLFADPDLIPKN